MNNVEKNKTNTEKEEKEFFRLEAKRADQVYALAEENEQDYKLNFVGWINTFTKRPFLAEEMYEWRDDTLDILLDLKPRRVFDIGCGSGMLLFSLVDHVDEYVAIDISREGVEYVHSRLNKAQKKKTSLYVMDGFDIDKLDDTGFDLVVINSVTQYMGGEEHFAALIGKCADKLAENGKIFLGDIKEAWNRDRFYKAWELSNKADFSDLAERVALRKESDSEFYMSREFLNSLKDKVSRIKYIDFFSKRGNHPTEMNLFRFNTLLYLDEPKKIEYNSVFDCNGKTTLDIKNILTDGADSDILKFTNIRNRFLLQHFNEMLNENNELEGSIAVKEACDILKSRGYKPFAMISEENYECFDIIAKKSDDLQ